MAVVALGRKKNSPDPERYKAYHGSHCELLLNNPVDRDVFESTCDLWYGEFLYQGKYYNCAGCLVDIDVKDSRQYLIRQATVAHDKEALLRLLQPELQLVEKTFAGIPYVAYASGSKGLHVYAKNPDGWLCAERPTEFTASCLGAFLKNCFPADFVSVIDQSFYPHNKGLRPYSCRHPVTGIEPFRLVVSPGWTAGSRETDEDGFLSWVCEFLRTLAATQAVPCQDIMFDQAALPMSSVTRPIATTPFTELNEFSRLGLEQYVLEKSGHVLVSQSAGKTKRYLIFGDKGGNPLEKAWCPIAKGFHKTNCVSWIRFQNCSIASCFNEMCCGKTFVLRPPIPKPVTCPPESSGVAEENITVLANDGNMLYLPRDQVVASLKEHRLSVVLANLGSGKTETIRKHISDLLTLNKDARVLIIATRRQQVSGWMNFFGDLGFAHYELVKGCLYETPRLVVCLNSLLRILAPPTDSGYCALQQYDLLVLDEVDSLSRWLGGSMLENNVAIFETMKLLVKTSKSTVCMDGLPTMATGMMLKALGHFDEFHWTVFNRYRFREVLLVNQTSYFLKAFKSALAEGLNVYFVSNSKRAVTRFKDYAIHACGIPEAEIMAIYGDMSQTDRELSGNPDNWTRYRLVLANTSLGPGISFNPVESPRHFAKVFCLTKPAYGISPEDMAQLIDRVRNPSRNQIVVMVLRTSFKQSKLAASADSVLAKRCQTIGSYAEAAYNVVAPIRKSRADLLLQQEEQKLYAQFAALGKTVPVRRKAMLGAARSRQPLAILPYYNEETGELEGRPKAMNFGLIFHTPPINVFCAQIEVLSLHWSADSEAFLERLEEILHCQGSAISTVGPRELFVDDKDVVLASHMTFLDKLAAEADSDDAKHLCNLDLLEKQRSFLTDEQYATVQTIVHRNKVPGADTNLYRLASVLNNYNGTHGSIMEAIEHDVSRQFEVPLDHSTYLRDSSIRLGALPRKADLNHQPTKGELFECLNNVFEYLDHEWDPQTRSPKCKSSSGLYSTATWLEMADEHQLPLWQEVQKFCELRIRENRDFLHNGSLRVQSFMDSPVPPPPPDNHRLLFNILWNLLAWAGFPVIVKDVRRETTVDGIKKKRTLHLVEFDHSFINLGKALLGRRLDGSEAPSNECLKDYFIWKEEWDAKHTVTPKKTRRSNPGRQ